VLVGFLRTILLLLLGFVISHLITAWGIAIFSHKAFSLNYPFSLVNFYLRNLLNLKSLSGFFHVFFWFYLVATIIPLEIYRIFFEEDFKNSKNKYGFAKFASAKTIKKMGLTSKDGIVFGLIRRNFLQKIFHQKRIIKSNQPLSSLIIAPTGTGKTAGFIIPTLKSINNSVVIFDIKGELYNKTSATRSKLGQKIFILDVEEGNIKFNPFARNQLPQNHKKLKSYVKNISNFIFDNQGNSEGGPRKENNYFVSSAKELFNTLVLYLILENGYTTITKVKELLLGSNNPKQIFLTIHEKIIDKEEAETDPNTKQLLGQVREGANQIVQICDAKDQFLGVVGSLTTILAAFDDLEIKDIIDCENSSVVAKNLRKEKITVYIRVKDVDLERLRPVISLFFETLIGDIISNDPAPEDNQITFVLDEFGNLGRISKLIKATTISRSYKLNQIFILQDLAQISSIYSREERSILESNTAYKIILQQNNFDTAKGISELIGARTDAKISKSSKESKKMNDRDSFSVSQEGIPLISPQDILNLNKNRCLIVVQGYAANVILADIAWYFKYNL